MKNARKFMFQKFAPFHVSLFSCMNAHRCAVLLSVLQIAAYGHVELCNESPCIRTYKDLGTAWPHSDVSEDVPFISPYIADWSFGSSDEGR